MRDLRHRPRRDRGIEHLDERVACPHDDAIVSAPVPPAIVERGKLSDRFIVEALCDKYVECQPVERQCSRFARAGVEIAPQTVGRSVAKAIDLLMPVANLIHQKTRGPGLLGTDSTNLPVLDRKVTERILLVCTTPSYSPESNGMAEAFVKTFQRDYVYLAEVHTANAVLRAVGAWFDDYNNHHPHSGFRRHRARRRLRGSPLDQRVAPPMRNRGLKPSG